jgi:Cu(I)/Ag(I) efflux system protein CusF
MIPRLYRPLVMGLLPLALIACMNPAPMVAEESAAVPLGVDLGGSGPVATSVEPKPPTRVALAGEGQATHPQHGSDMQMAHEGHNDAHGTGTVNSVDPAQHKINLSHQAIPDIGWPAMTMEFPVATSVDLKPIKPGTRINFTIEKSQSGMYEIKAITPAGATR